MLGSRGKTHANKSRCLALGLALALAAGSVGGYEAPASAAQTQGGTPAVRTVGDSTGPTIETLSAMMVKYGKTPLPTVQEMQNALGKMLLEKIKALLKKTINTTEFQNDFYDLQLFYNDMNLPTVAVVEYTRTMEEDKSAQYTDMYSKLVTLYEDAKTALRQIYAVSNITRSSENLDTFLNRMVLDDDSAFNAVSNYISHYDMTANYEVMIPCLLGSDVLNREKMRYYLLDDFPRNKTFLEKFGFTVAKGSDVYLPEMPKASGGIKPEDFLTYLELYNKLLDEYDVEIAYRHLGYDKNSVLPIRGKMKAFATSGSKDTIYFESDTNSGDKEDGLYTVYSKLSLPVAQGGLGNQGAADSFIRTLFNGADILELLQQYQDLKSFLTALYSLPETGPKSSEEVSKAITTYNSYLALTDSEKAKLDSQDLARLKTVTPAKDSIEEVVRLIGAIRYPTTENEYRTIFLPALQAAETAYNALLVKYPNMGVENFIDNRTLLTVDYKTYKNYQDRLFEALNISDSNVCNKLATAITPLRTELQSLNKTNPTVFNHLIGYSTFETMYNDATTAKKLRDRVDVLMISPTADDSAELNSIKTAVSALNPRAKAYFGTLYEQYIQALEYGTYTDDLNKANRVTTLIERIGTVNANSGAKIEAARSGYDSLTDLQKSLVKNYNTLLAAESTFKQLSQDISYATVTNIKKGYVYTHSDIQPVPVVKVNGVTLSQGSQYTVTYSDNQNVGTATVVITAVAGGGFTGTYTKQFSIVQDSVENCSVSGLKKKYKYTGKKIKPTFTVKVNGFVLDKGSDYKVIYSNNKKPGKASIKIRGIGNYKGSRTVTFRIYKAKKNTKKKK